MEDDNPAELIEAYFERGWTDGLPVVPPSRQIHRRDAGRRGRLHGDETIGEIEERGVVVSAEKLAINAVMAGCRPEYGPVVVAAIRGLCHPQFAYHGPPEQHGRLGHGLDRQWARRPTHRRELRQQRLRPGPRVRMPRSGARCASPMMNVMNTRPGFLDRATLGNPGKYSFCFAENEVDHPWEPLHVEPRVAAPIKAPSPCTPSNSLCPVYNQLAATPEPLLRCFADALCHLGTPNLRGFNQSLVVFAGEHSDVLRQSRWNKGDVPQFSWSMHAARSPISSAPAAARGRSSPADEHDVQARLRAPRGHSHRLRGRPGRKLVGLLARLGQ